MVLALLILLPLLGVAVGEFCTRSRQSWIARASLLCIICCLAIVTRGMFHDRATGWSWPVDRTSRSLFEFSWHVTRGSVPMLWLALLAGGTAFVLEAGQRRHRIPGLIAAAMLIAVADDVTSLLTGGFWASLMLWLIFPSASQPADQAPDKERELLKWQIGGWMCVMLSLAALAGGLSLLRSAPRAAPSETGFLLTADLGRIPQVIGQHPAALEMWEQIRGWLLIPAITATLILSGNFPFHGWLRRVDAASNFVERMLLHSLVARLGVYVLLQTILPIYSGAPQLIMFGLAVPALAGMFILAAELQTLELDEVDWQIIPLEWLSHWGLLIVALNALRPELALWSGIILPAALAMVWVLAHSPETESPFARLVAGLAMCGVPGIAATSSFFTLTLNWSKTGTPFDLLVWVGLWGAVFAFSLRVVPELIRSAVGQRPAARHTSLTWCWLLLWATLSVTTMTTKFDVEPVDSEPAQEDSISGVTP